LERAASIYLRQLVSEQTRARMTFIDSAGAVGSFNKISNSTVFGAGAINIAIP
jgi:hypothetical protein